MNLISFFEAVPGSNVLVLPDEPSFTVLAVTEGYLSLTGQTKESVTGKSIFKSFPPGPDPSSYTFEHELLASFAKVIQQLRQQHLPVKRYHAALKDGSHSERYIKAVNKPVLDEEGRLVYIIHTINDVTAQVNTVKQEEEKKSIKQAHDLIMQAPVAIAVLKGAGLVIELANEMIAEVWGKGKEIEGKPIEEVLPEIKGQGFIDLLNGVRETGIPYHAYEAPVSLVRSGKEEVAYFNFVYQAYYEESSTSPAGVLIFATEVTAWIGIKKELAEKEESLALAMEIGKLGNYNINLLTNTSTFSQQVKDWFGLEQQNNPLDDTMSHIHPDERELVAKTIARSMDKGWNGRHDIVYRANTPKDVPELYVRSIGQVQYKNGVPVALTGIVQDVTQQVIARKKIEESEAYFRALADQAPLIIFIADAEGNVSYWNKYWLEFTGQTLEESLGSKSWAKNTHNDDFSLLLNTYLAAAKARRQYTIEIRMKRWDGKYRYLNFTGTPRYLPNGAFDGFIGTAVDTTERRHAEDALHKSEQNLRNIFARAPVAMALFRGAGFTIEIANQRMLEQWNKTAADVLQKSLLKVLPPARVRKYEDIMRKVLTTGEPYSAFGAPIPVTRNGQSYTAYVSFAFEALREADGNITGIMCVSSEVTDQILARQKIEEVVAQRTTELDKAIQQLLQSNIELNQFAYIASHDLQEPLRKVKIFTGILEKILGTVPQQAKEYFLKIHSSTERMQTLINDVLKYSQLSKEEERFEKVDLNRIFENVLEDYELLIEQKNAVVTAAALPFIEAIPLQMSQLFTNLVSNALKFSSEERSLEITVTAKELSKQEVQSHKDLYEDKLYQAIVFKDNGIGFNEEYAQKIFTIFYRLHGKLEYKGTGIGLSLCKKIVLNHHGVIYANSSPGLGTSITAILPLTQDA